MEQYWDVPLIPTLLIAAGVIYFIVDAWRRWGEEK